MNAPQTRPRIQVGDSITVYDERAVVTAVLNTGSSTLTPSHQLALITYRVGNLPGNREVTAVLTSHGWTVSTEGFIANHAATAPWATKT